MLISFEGIDGSGKSTQIKLLGEWLEARSYKVITVREPGATILSENIRDILLHTRQSITPTAELLLFNAARAQLVQNVILPAIDGGAIVLCDRYTDSTTAYQGYGRGLNLRNVEECNRIGALAVYPVLTLFFDVPFEQAQLRITFQAGQHEHDRMERSGRGFFERVREGYLAIAAAEPARFHVIEGTKDRQAIHNEVCRIVGETLQL